VLAPLLRALPASTHSCSAVISASNTLMMMPAIVRDALIHARRAPGLVLFDTLALYDKDQLY
jgi:hypothetical protein